MRTSRISFGDKVAIVATDCTKALGILGQTGVVHGFTSLSQTGVKVIGDTVDDYAIAVELEGKPEALWFAEGLLRLVDHQPGTTVKIAVDASYVTSVVNRAK